MRLLHPFFQQSYLQHNLLAPHKLVWQRLSHCSGGAGAGMIPQCRSGYRREDGADNPLEFSSHIQSSVGEGDSSRCALPPLLGLSEGDLVSWWRGAADVCLSLSWPSLPLLELAPSSGALAKGIGVCVGSGSACCLPAQSFGVWICCGSCSQRPGTWAAQAMVSALWLLAKTCTRATEQVGLVRLIFLPWCLQPEQLAGERRCPVPPSD